MTPATDGSRQSAVNGPPLLQPCPQRHDVDACATRPLAQRGRVAVQREKTVGIWGQLNWFKDGSIVRPTPTKPVTNRRGLDAGYARPLSHGFRRAIDCKSRIASMVVLLFMRRRPSAILRSVRSFVVDSIQRRAEWPWPHVLEECIEVSPPSFTHADSARSVVAVLCVLLVVAASNRVAPGIACAVPSTVLPPLLSSEAVGYALISHACRASSAVRSGEAPGRVSARVGAVFIVPPKRDFAMIPARS